MKFSYLSLVGLGAFCEPSLATFRSNQVALIGQNYEVAVSDSGPTIVFVGGVTSSTEHITGTASYIDPPVPYIQARLALDIYDIKWTRFFDNTCFEKVSALKVMRDASIRPTDAATKTSTHIVAFLKGRDQTTECKNSLFFFGQVTGEFYGRFEIPFIDSPTLNTQLVYFMKDSVQHVLFANKYGSNTETFEPAIIDFHAD